MPGRGARRQERPVICWRGDLSRHQSSYKWGGMEPLQCVAFPLAGKPACLLSYRFWGC
ncbi:hypothetical protein [Azospirillum endophyticum]